MIFLFDEYWLTMINHYSASDGLWVYQFRTPRTWVVSFASLWLLAQTLKIIEAGNRSNRWAHLDFSMMRLRQCHDDLQGLMRQLRQFRQQEHLCDVVLKSVDGTLHPAHRNVLSAASDALKTWLCAPFREAEEIRQGNPVQMTASSRVVDAFLDYLYGGDPEVASTDAMELLRLACRYELPRLSASLASDLRASLDSKLALQLLPEAQVFGLDELRQACEEHIAHDFQQCALQQDFLELSAPQLQRILQRRDLKVSREETIVEGLLRWSNFRSERNREMVLLLADIDFPSLSAGNLEILRRAAQSFGPAGGYLECHVREAMAVHRKRPVGDISNSHPPKRRCLARWSAGLGASHPPHHEENRVTPHISSCGPTLQWHQGAFLLRDNGNDRVVSCKPCDTSFRIYAGQGAPVNGFNDLSRSTEHAVSPAGELFVVLFQDTGQHLLRIHDGVGQVLLELTDCVGLCCSPNGVLYVLENRGQRVQKLGRLGSNDNLPHWAASCRSARKFQGYVCYGRRGSLHNAAFPCVAFACRRLCA